MVSLVPYVKSSYSVPVRLILRVKDHADRPVFRFFADSLALSLWQELVRLDVSEASVLLTFVPRRPSAVRLTGLDQSAMLARTLASRLSLPYMVLLRHKSQHRRETAQKYLSAAEREHNAKTSFLLKNPDTDLSGKTVLLVDDICTTGASLAACTHLLYRCGAENVIAVTIGRTHEAQPRA